MTKSGDVLTAMEDVIVASRNFRTQHGKRQQVSEDPGVFVTRHALMRRVRG